MRKYTCEPAEKLPQEAG